MQALAASGLRALRYAKEVEQVGSVVACDNDKGICFLLGKPQLIHAFGFEIIWVIQSMCERGSFEVKWCIC